MSTWGGRMCLMPLRLCKSQHCNGALNFLYPCISLGWLFSLDKVKVLWFCERHSVASISEVRAVSVECPLENGITLKGVCVAYYKHENIMYVFRFQ